MWLLQFRHYLNFAHSPKPASSFYAKANSALAPL